LIFLLPLPKRRNPPPHRWLAVERLRPLRPLALDTDDGSNLWPTVEE
jgi:hypothetical protein